MKYLTFTDRGQALAEQLSQTLGGQVSRFTPGFSMEDWTAEGFRNREDLVFIGAVGIAVRAIAPHVRSKVTDPAVVAVDESGTFAVPVLSGHLGGANDLARRIATVCGAVPVVTTATDVNQRFSIDEWAARRGLSIESMDAAKRFSAADQAGVRQAALGQNHHLPQRFPHPRGAAPGGGPDYRGSLGHPAFLDPGAGDRGPPGSAPNRSAGGGLQEGDPPGAD